MPPKQRDRWRGKTVFLTWSRYAIIKPKLEEVWGRVKPMFPNEIEDWSICAEQHSPDELLTVGHKTPSKYIWHIHAIVRSEVDCKSSAFDLFSPELDMAVHPHIKMVGATWRRVVTYIQKDGYFIGTAQGIPTKPPWKGYLRDKADKAAYLEDNVPEVKIVWPQSYLGIELKKPDAAHRLRHVYLYGNSDAGKTYGLRNVHGYRCSADPKYRFERYRGEEIIIFDDCIPTWEEMVAISNTTPHKVEVPGGSRYTRVYFEPNTVRTMIIISNRVAPWHDWPTIPAARWTTRFQEFQVVPGQQAVLLRGEPVSLEKQLERLALIAQLRASLGHSPPDHHPSLSSVPSTL